MSLGFIKTVTLTGILSIIAGCGGGGGGGGSNESPNESISGSIISPRMIQNEQCPNGGVEIELGIDANGNGRLDPDEVDHARTQTVCHGSDGVNGSDGTSGTDGLNSLVFIADSAEGECEHGGQTVTTGQDNNQNGVLDQSETSQSQTICNVVSGIDGINSLVATSEEPSGENCAVGGIKIDSGLDNNASNSLDEDEIQSTNYICHAVDGQAGESVDLSALLIETIEEANGANCLHGGDKHQIGLDTNANSQLEAEEILSASYSCNENSPPTIHFTHDGQVIAGTQYSIELIGQDAYGDDVALSIVNKPVWLTETRLAADRIQLSGLAPTEIDQSFIIEASATDSDLTGNAQLSLNTIDGILLSATAASVTEGNSGSQEGVFNVQISTAATGVLQVHYNLVSATSQQGQDWQADTYAGVLVFSAGETAKQISLEILADQRFELGEAIGLKIQSVDYAGSELVQVSSYTLLHIINDDPLVIHADQENSVPVFTAYYGGIGDFALNNQPAWMAAATQWQYGQAVTLTGNPSVEYIGTQGSADLSIASHSNYGDITSATYHIEYTISEGDRDSDGVVNSQDAFPDNASAQTDSDNDGLGDEWEIANFENLSLASATSDFDDNGLTDLSAFQNNTPVNDISFSFESGALPDGWVNTGDVDWVVSNEQSYHGDYALTLAQPLAPGKVARVRFEVTTQAGNLSLFSKREGDLSYDNQLRIRIDGSGNYISLNSDYWGGSNSNITAGTHKIEIEFVNYSSFGNAPIVYIDHISGLLGTVPADRDGDGVVNIDDLFPDRADAATDTDEDGIADEWEQKNYFQICQIINIVCDLENQLNLYTEDSDLDNDGLSDLNEFLAGTLPYDTDSDNDGPYGDFPVGYCKYGHIPAEYCNDDSVDIFPTDSRYHDDIDGDGLADKWEQRHFAALDVSDGTQDSDGDSLTDAEEFALDSMPAVDTDADGYADVVDAFPNDSRYALDNDGDGMADEWENSHGGTYMFTAEGDYDEDQRTDLNEFIFETDPRVSDVNAATDTDSDGLGDEWEMANFESLDIANATSDFDGNGVTDLSAFQNNTAISDADVDGVADDVDAFPNDNRYALDNDGDGIADEWEREYCLQVTGDEWICSENYYNPENALIYFSANSDYDHDQRTDLNEFIFETDPTVIDVNAATDTDNDGLGDEWEMANFESLDIANATSDFDGNGVTDLSAFQNNTALNDISFNFESGELPNGWVNSGDVDWVVSNSESYEGDYALTLAQALEPGQVARVSFDISSNAGQWSLRNTLISGAASRGGLNWFIDETNNYIYQQEGYWYNNSTAVSAGDHRVVFEYRNTSSSTDALMVYIDNLTGLTGIVPGDRDGDGVANGSDLYPDRSDAASDSDEDGIGDEWEMTYFGTLDRVNAESDYDGDSLSDVDEFVAGTRPDTSDSDYDGYDDVTDAYPTDNRYQQDTDGDGLADKWELRYFAALDVSDGTQDSDGDSLTDAQEFALGSMPAVDTDADGYADVVDAFPNDNRYALDADSDGMADAWENNHGGTYMFTAEGDYDHDQRTDLNEFIFETDPRVIDVNAATDTDNDGLGDEWEMANFESLEIANATSDFDGNGVTDLLAFQNNTAISDADLDGVADDVDAFPNDSRYALDNDGDGIADEWENQYYSTGAFSTEGDYDNDGRTDLKEFIDGTNPTIVDLRAVEDIVAVVKGQTVSFNPTANDVSNRENITVSNFELPVAGSLQDNLDGTFTYTATNERLGWLRLAYTANDGESDAIGEIFIHIVEQAPAQVIRIDSSDYGSHSMALFDDGSVYTWGANGSGQLGLGTTINNYVPTRVGGLPEIKDFALGYEYSLALDVDGAVWYWGRSVTSPMQITLSEGLVIDDIAASYSEMYLLDSNGNVYTEYADANLSIPNQVAGFSDISEINAGNGHLLALDNNGLVWARGNNSSGQLGYGQDTGSSNTPVQVSKISNIASIEAANDQSFAIDDQGQLFAWGGNSYGRLGDGTTVNRNVPVLVKGVVGVVEVRAGYYHALVRTESGELYGMGLNSDLQLGANLGSYSQWHVPTLVIEETVQSIGAGGFSSFIIDTDGLSYSFGSNSSGHLGDGTTDSRSEPVEISWLLDGVISELGKEGFEWGRIPPYWRNSGSNWQVVQDVAKSGSYSARVKDRLNDNASASLGLQIATGAGDVSFSIKTSTEANYDELIFYIDGVEQARYSGENDWVDTVAISIDAGVHSFEWIYHKDGGTSVGDDTVWLDDIQLPVDSDGDGIIDSIDAEPYIPAAP